MRQYLIVIDMQHDFIYGSLGSAEGKAIVPAIIHKIKDFDGEVIFTKDTHQTNYLSTLEGHYLPVTHCVNYTEGWFLIDELEELQQLGNWKTYLKNTFGCVNLAIDLRAEHEKQAIDSIELIGVCTDICVISNALLFKAYLPEVPIKVIGDCCAGVTIDSHKRALEAMKMCHIEIV